jgi:hypothetical protein
MKNEVLCKVLCHNICCLISAFYELGITPDFSTDSKEPEAAAVDIAKPHLLAVTNS